MTNRYLISGKVQGVGFRYFVKSHAETLRLRGWVKNNHDGQVEIIAQGSSEVIQSFEVILRRGSPLSFIDHVQVFSLKEEVTLPLFSIRS